MCYCYRILFQNKEAKQKWQMISMMNPLMTDGTRMMMTQTEKHRRMIDMEKKAEFKDIAEMVEKWILR